MASLLNAATDPYLLNRALIRAISTGEIPIQVGLSGDPTLVMMTGFNGRLLQDFFESTGCPTEQLPNNPPDHFHSNPHGTCNEIPVSREKRVLIVALDSVVEVDELLGTVPVDFFNMAVVVIRQILPVGEHRAFLHRKFMKISPTVSVFDLAESATTSRRSRKPELSVVVPIYGVEKQLPDLLGALERSQVDHHIEIVLVDDGSTDNSGKIAAEWAERHPDRIAVKKENGGCWSARNHGLNLANGDYVLFADADDVVNPEGLHSLMDAALVTQADVIRGEWTSFRDGFDPGDVVEYHQLSILNAEKNSRPRNSFLESSPSIWRNLYRRQFLIHHNIRFPAFPRFDDLPFFFKVSRHIASLVDVPVIVYRYRLSRLGQDTGATDKRLFVLFPIFDWMKADVAMHGNAGDYRDLVGVRLASDLWAIRLLDADLRPPYAQRVFRELLSDPEPFSRLDTMAGLAKRTRTWGVPQVVRGLGQMAISLTGYWRLKSTRSRLRFGESTTKGGADF